MDKNTLENRLNRIIHLYDHLDELIETLPVRMPNGAKEIVKKIIFGNKEINLLINGIKERRAPRLILMGTTGVGKSNLINSIFGQYIAKTSPVTIGTRELTRYNYESDGEILFEVIDTRGIAEASTSDDSKKERRPSAEEDFIQALKDFDPDAVLYLTPATVRSRMDEDVQYIKEMHRKIGHEIPLVTVLTQVDRLEPEMEKEATSYSESKKNNIQAKVTELEGLMKTHEIKVATIIPVSTFIVWSATDPHLLSVEERKELTIQFDGRYNVDALLDFLENNIDFRASIHLMMSTRIDRVLKKISEAITKGFATASTTIAVTPIPFSDIAVLLPLQMILVTFIAYLSGTDVNKNSAKEFLIGIGGVGALGYGLRALAQQGSKFLNVVLPGTGSVVSSALAFSGTYAIGKTAQAYYIDKKPKSELDNIMKQASDDAKGGRNLQD